MGLGGDTLQQAIQYFILNRCSFSGSTLSGGFSQEATGGSRRRPSTVAALDFADIEIHNADFLGSWSRRWSPSPTWCFGSAVFLEKVKVIREQRRHARIV
jgi:hypothetical protein